MGLGQRILLLGGTGAARRLAEELAAAVPDAHIIYSLAGTTPNPRLPHAANIEARIGGFGGVAGLAAFLHAQRITALIDATHPHARHMPLHAAEAATLAGVPHARFLPSATDICIRHCLARPGNPEPCTQERAALDARVKPGHDRGGEPVVLVDSIADMAGLLPPGARVFAALGSRGLAELAPRSDLWLTARMISLPTFTPPPRWRLLKGRAAMPRASIAAELALLRATKAQWLLARDSAGSARLVRAAMLLGKSALLLRVPPAPQGMPVLHDVSDVLGWLGLAQAELQLVGISAPDRNVHAGIGGQP